MIRLGLRTRFFLYSNTVIAVTMILVTVISMAHERRTSSEATDRRGRSIVEAMAIPITDALLFEDLGLVMESGLIENHISELLARNRDFMLYAVVVDADGRVTHSSRWDLLGTRFDRALAADAIGSGTITEILEVDGEQVLEVRTTLNISTKYWGSLAVGFSLSSIEAQVERLARRAIIVALVLMLFNSVVTALYVESLIRPILDLNRTMNRAGRGDLSVRAAVRSRDEVGELTKVFNLMMDELEEARDREQVQRTQLAHTEKMAAVGTLAAGVAHEVNNPLAGVLACIENLRANPDDEEMRERYLALIEDGLKRIERTVTNLLNFSRQRELRAEATSLNHNLKHVVELVGYQLRKSGVEIDLDLDPSDAMVMADHFQMEQLFLNLILNAMSAMPDGGRLVLSTRAGRDQTVVAEIADTGVGIDAAIRDQIFDPFFTTRDVGEGTGLGLAVSDTIVRAHGGSIEVESTTGQGSVFRVRLPAVDPAPEQEGP